MEFLKREPPVKAGIRLPFHVVSERMSRIYNVAIKEYVDQKGIITKKHSTFKLTKEEISHLENALLMSSVMKHVNDINKYSKALNKEMNKSLKRAGVSQIRRRHIKKFIDKIVMEKVLGFSLSVDASKKPEVPNHLDDKRLDHIKTKYDKPGEVIPEYIKNFDPKASHTIPTAEYIENRIANTTIDQMNKSSGNELFIGPPDEMMLYYKDKGYNFVGQIKSPSSTPYYYFENKNDPGKHIIVISGITNVSRFNHQLLQLKCAGIDLKNITVRGDFESLLEKNNQLLDKSLKQFDHPIDMAFIGNRGDVMTTLAERLYPQLLPKLPDNSTKSERLEHEKRAEKLLNAHHYQTQEIGPYKFSSVNVEIDGKQGTILAMRMPNGDLAGYATRILLTNGVKNLIMVGAGGSFDEHLSTEGGLQVLQKSTYNQESIGIDKDHVLQPNLKGLEVNNNGVNVTVDSPLVETLKWLESSKQLKGSSVDVETYHIFKNFDRYEVNAKILPGIFTSDVLGLHPLVEKINPANAWKKLPELANSVFDLLKVQSAIVPLAEQ